MPDQIQELLALARNHREVGDGKKLVEVFKKLQEIQPDERNWKVAAACALGELGFVEDVNSQINATELTSQEASMVAVALQKSGANDAAAELLQTVLEKILLMRKL